MATPTTTTVPASTPFVRWADRDFTGLAFTGAAGMRLKKALLKNRATRAARVEK